MASEKPIIDYNALLADLEGKKAAIEALIAYVRIAQTINIPTLADISQGGIRTIQLESGSPSGSGYSGYSGSPIQPDDVPAGAFHGKSVPVAIKAYLSMVKKKQTTREIIGALKKGGTESTSSKFDQIVYNALRRMQKVTGEILRSGEAWGMAEWWPASVRRTSVGKMANDKIGKKKKKPRRTKFPKGSAAVEIPQAKPYGTKQRILKMISDNRKIDDSTIATALDVNQKVIKMMIGKLIKRGTLKRLENGEFDLIG